MKTGFKRKLEPLGRITLPIEIRRSLGMEEGERLEISVNDYKTYNKLKKS